MKKFLLAIIFIFLIPSICFASWNAYLAGARTKYRPNDTIPTDTSLTVNVVKGQFAVWQIPMKIDGEDVTTVNATCTTPTKGGDTLTVPLIYKEYLHNIMVPSRQNNWGGLGTNLGNPIGEIPDALIPKVDAYYSETRNAFPFNISRISPVYAFPIIKIPWGGAHNSSVKTNNTATTLPTIGGTYSGTGLKNYHIVVDGAGAKGVATFKWTTSSINIKQINWDSGTQKATVTTYVAHGFIATDTVRIKSSYSTLNGDVTVLGGADAPTTYTFKYSIAAVAGYSVSQLGGGTAIKTWNETAQTTGDAIALDTPDEGLTITFPVQTYAVGDEWEFYVNTTRVETLWMESYVPTNAVAGDYTSTITITANGKADITLNLTIKVYNLAIGKEPTIPIDFKAEINHPIRGHFHTSWFDNDCNNDIDGASCDLTHVALARRYVESGLRHRMSMPYISPNYVWTGSTLTNWEPTIKPWFSPYLNGTWTQGAEPTGIKYSSFWFREAPWMVRSSSVDADLDYTTLEKAKITTFAGLMDAEGWMTTFKPTIMTAEEPTVYADAGTCPTSGSCPKTAIQNAYDSMKAINANFRALVHKRYVSEWVGYVDVWDSNGLNFAGYPRSTYDTEIANGNELWAYQACDMKACGATGNSAYDLNVTYGIDSPMTDIIGWHWLMYDNDVRGDFYYMALEAQSYYDETLYTGVAQQDIWDVTLNYGGNIEGTFWYPGRVSAGGHPIGGSADTDIPIESLRLKAYRMGQEDYEIFKLTSRSANSLGQVQSAVGTGKWQFTYGLPSASNMETARTNILDELLGQPPAIVPTVTTTAISSITSASASSGGDVIYDGGGTVSARGVCWSTSFNPTTADSKTTNGSGVGVFTSSITGLSPQITYYVRAYATNEIGTSYGSNIIFTSLGRITLGTGPALRIDTGPAFKVE